MSSPSIETIRTAAQVLSGAGNELDPVVAMASNASFVLLGEASHGTHDFYDLRARITQRLIAEHGFNAVVIEADWPDAHRVHRYVQGENSAGAPDQALACFDKFPEWMWRNTVIRDFIAFLRAHNDKLADSDRKTGFYGMDLYSLYRSRAAVIRYLESSDPEAARAARERYSCFDHFGEDTQSYGYTVAFGGRPSCEDAAIQQLLDLQGRDGEDEDTFYAEQNARLVKNSEEYFRTMFGGRVSSWNLRDRHMADTVDAIYNHLALRGREPKLVLWAHNSHLGDARATEMGRRGEWNVGQLVRQRHPGKSVLIGFSTYTGTVMAADDWGAPGELKQVKPGMSGSYERLFHETGIDRFFLDLRQTQLNGRLLERAIGVIYRPDTERYSHYFHASLGSQFDGIIHLDETRAITPLERPRPVADDSPKDADQLVADTYPTGM